MYTVYVLISKIDPEKLYVGFTADLPSRIQKHNDNKSPYTRKYAPWELHTYTVFKQKDKAKEFEKYLKSGSGFAFLKKRFL